MTAATATTSADAGTAVRRTGDPLVRVTRLHFVAWPYALPWPWGILALSFAVNLAIFGSVDEAQEAWTGGLASLYGVQIFAYVSLFTRMFPFALGMSVTRRAYYLGTWLYVALEALVYGAVLLALRLVEEATGGWGMSLEYFGLSFVRSDSLALQYAVYVVPFLLLAGVGACVGLVITRWSYNGVFALLAGLVVVPGVLVLVVSRAGWWRDIGDWFAGQSAGALFAGWPLPFVVVLGLLGYATIRRATP
jgi:hypothetical protein